MEGGFLAGRPRLAAVADLVPPGSRVADVGTDHGLLPRALLGARRIEHCIATDVVGREAIAWLPREGPTPPGLEFRRGDGLSVLRPQDRLDVVVLAGLGARTIVRLLEHPGREALGLRRLVLQPQTEPHRLRRWLRERRLGIVDERFVRERGHAYVALAAEPGATPHEAWNGLTVEDLDDAGPCLVLRGEPGLREHWRKRLEREERILRRATPGPARTRALARRDRARRLVEVLRSRDTIAASEPPAWQV